MSIDGTNLIKLPEPALIFHYNQPMEDPRDGLTLFGPLDAGKPYGIRFSVIGTKEGIQRFKKWLERIHGPISNPPHQISHPYFPGFESVFRIPWSSKPTIELEIIDEELKKSVLIGDKYHRVYETVNIYSERITDVLRQEDSAVDIWFVVIPDYVYKYCRPKSEVEIDQRIEIKHRMPRRLALKSVSSPFLFKELQSAAKPYHYDVDFHNQLKGRFLGRDCPIQIIRESTIAHRDFLDRFGKPTRNLDPVQTDIAWNLSTATFYKAGGRPWRLGNIRQGVCYIGLAFKEDEKSGDPKSACCAAQMFMDSGDGVVFKGAVGPWYSGRKGDFHLNRRAAKEVVEMAIKSYITKRGKSPQELFLHGKVRFNDEEWTGFQEAVDLSTNLVGVRIRPDSNLKLYRKGTHPVLRGLAYIRDERTAYLWTKGFIPRLQTYPGREVPKPLLIDVCRGNADIKTILHNILALTKLNYNACIFADGMPVTIRFADAVGEILTAGPMENIPPLPFKYYI